MSERNELRPAPVSEPALSLSGQGEAQVHLSPNQRAWNRFKKNKAAWFSSILFLILLFALFLWPMFRSQTGVAISEMQFAEPNPGNWFGTDVHGRDLLSRILDGARISLLVGLVGAGVSLVIGVFWGAVAGYLGGAWDNVMMRVVDVLYSLPSIIFVIVLITTLEGTFKTWLNKVFSPELAASSRLIFLFVGLGAVSWLTMSRIVRGQVLTLRSRNFVDASRALGASHTRILWHHILPNVFGIIIVYLTLTIPSIILYESFLSFLGLGIQPPQASLGSLISEGAAQINSIRIFWWVVVFPALTLAVMLLTLNFMGDGLRDAFDPRGDS